MRFFYLLAVYCVAPLMLGFWFVRGMRNRAYLDRLGQRFGVGFPDVKRASLWVHAVSVGEVQAAIPLIKALQSRYVHRDIVVTTVTPTGAARVKAIFGDSVIHAYVPFETNGAVRRFFDRVKPALAIIMETEIWPNLYNECGIRRVPLVLASARISPKSVSRYRRLVPLFREALSHGIVIAAQSEADASRFRELGAAPARTFVTGNLKFDIELRADVHADGGRLRAALFADRPVWVAASTHEREETAVLEAHARVLERYPDAVVVVIPRHPERFDEVARTIADSSIPFARRTLEEHLTASHSVYLADTMGEVMQFYAAADVCFVGGSLVPIGGHNLLEPASLGRATVTGPHWFNAEDIAKRLLEAQAIEVVRDANDLHSKVVALLEDPVARHTMGQNGLTVINNNRGALDALLQLIDPLVSPSQSQER